MIYGVKHNENIQLDTPGESIRSTSGKTILVNLIPNMLLKCDPKPPFYVLSGWDKYMVNSASGWAGYL